MRNVDRTSINPAVRSAKPPGRGPYVARNKAKFGRSPHNRWANPWGLYDVGRNAAAPGIPTVTGERLIQALEQAIVECDEDEKEQEEESSSWEKFKKEYGIKESLLEFSNQTQYYASFIVRDHRESPDQQAIETAQSKIPNAQIFEFGNRIIDEYVTVVTNCPDLEDAILDDENFGHDCGLIDDWFVSFSSIDELRQKADAAIRELEGDED